MTRARSLALVALLVLAAVASPGVGGAAAVVADGDTVADTASQDQLDQACDATNVFLFSVTGGTYGGDVCAGITSSETVDALKNQSKNVTKVNIAQGALETKANANTFLTTQNNSLQNWETPLFADGQAAGVSSLQNGSSITDAQSAANSTVTERLSVKQANHLSAWNNQMHELENLAQMQANSSVSVFRWGWYYTGENHTQSVVYNQEAVSPSNFVDMQMTLANGSTRPVTVFWAQADDVASEPTSVTSPYVWSPVSQVTSVYWNGGVEQTSAVGTTIHVNSTSSTPITSIYDTMFSVNQGWKSQWTTAVDTGSRTKANLAPSIESISNAHAAGANWSELINPSTMAQEYATNYSSTGHWSYALATAAASGYALPDLNETSTMTVSYDGATYEGAVMSQQAPSGGTWEVGTTYNSSQIPGSQIILTTEGEHVDVNGEFTITSMTDKTGSALNSTTSQTYVFEAANNSEYYQMMDELNELREEIKQREPTTGGGSGGGGESSGGSSMTAAAIGGGLLLVALGGVFLYGRSS